jgi:hypothetical protein
MTDQKIDLTMLSRIDSEQKATASRVEGLDKSLQGLGREVSEIKGAIKPLTETPAWIRFLFYPLCVLAAGGVVATLITLLIKVNGIETFIHDNGGFIAGLRLQQNAANPDPQSVQDVKRVLTQARTAKITIPPDTVKSAGDKFVEASKNVPQAWEAVLQLAEYQRALNADTIPHLPNVRRLDSDPKYKPKIEIWMRASEPPGPAGTPHQLSSLPAETWLAGNAPPETAAKVELLDSPYPVSSDAQFIIFDWKRSDIAVSLDGMYLKNVIVRNARVHYSGRPVRLDNVYFVNCTFEIVQQPHGQEFARALLDTSSVTFATA